MDAVPGAQQLVQSGVRDDAFKEERRDRPAVVVTDGETGGLVGVNDDGAHHGAREREMIFRLHDVRILN